MGHSLLLYLYALRFVQKMKLYGSLLMTTIRHPSQGSEYEIHLFGEKQTYSFGMRGQDCMETYGKSRVGAFISGLFQHCPFMPGRYGFSHGTAKMLKKKTSSLQSLGDEHRFAKIFRSLISGIGYLLPFSCANLKELNA